MNEQWESALRRVCFHEDVLTVDVPAAVRSLSGVFYQDPPEPKALAEIRQRFFDERGHSR